MSKAPDWLNKASLNKTGNTVGNASEATQVRGRPGPKKSLVERKSVGLKFSEKRNSNIDELEQKLKLAGFDITRGRSEAVEVAVLTLLEILNNESSTSVWEVFINEVVGNEERLIED
ncbi:MAG: hypothetical protein GY941_29120 [Planctomycetes bacterium]|nr:hypothetical protein [Planctomycetota bacterium]